MISFGVNGSSTHVFLRFGTGVAMVSTFFSAGTSSPSFSFENSLISFSSTIFRMQRLKRLVLVYSKGSCAKEYCFLKKSSSVLLPLFCKN